MLGLITGLVGVPVAIITIAVAVSASFAPASGTLFCNYYINIKSST